MTRFLLLAVMGLSAGCYEDRPPRTVVVEQQAPVTEYYVMGGRYYHWHPQQTRWVEVRELPRGARAERVERLPDRRVVVERR